MTIIHVPVIEAALEVRLSCFRLQPEQVLAIPAIIMLEMAGPACCQFRVVKERDPACSLTLTVFGHVDTCSLSSDGIPQISNKSSQIPSL